jgi:cold shock CspA family protein
VPTIQSLCPDIHGKFRYTWGETVMLGSITQVSGDGSGCILAEDGNEVYFEKSGISGSGVDGLRVGHWVEFEVKHGFEELHAVGIKRLRRDVERCPEASQPHG